MNRAGFLKAAAAAIAAPYVARLERAGQALAAFGPAPIAADATTITVAGGVGRWVRLGDIVRVTSTGEALMVTGLPEDLGGDRWRWRVSRGIGSIAPAPMRRGDDVIVIAGTQYPGDELRSGMHWTEDRFEPRSGQLA